MLDEGAARAIAAIAADLDRLPAPEDRELARIHDRLKRLNGRQLKAIEAFVSVVEGVAGR
jgi:hypothetical protein